MLILSPQDFKDSTWEVMLQKGSKKKHKSKILYKLSKG